LRDLLQGLGLGRQLKRILKGAKVVTLIRGVDKQNSCGMCSFRESKDFHSYMAS